MFWRQSFLAQEMRLKYANASKVLAPICFEFGFESGSRALRCVTIIIDGSVRKCDANATQLSAFYVGTYTSKEAFFSGSEKLKYSSNNFLGRLPRHVEFPTDNLYPTKSRTLKRF
jgi:hypothetical protein